MRIHPDPAKARGDLVLALLELDGALLHQQVSCNFEYKATPGVVLVNKLCGHGSRGWAEPRGSSLKLVHEGSWKGGGAVMGETWPFPVTTGCRAQQWGYWECGRAEERGSPWELDGSLDRNLHPVDGYAAKWPLAAILRWSKMP